MTSHRTALLLASCMLLFTTSLVGVAVSSSHRGLGQLQYLAPPDGASVEVNFDIQRAEGEALLALRQALNNHPVFDGFTPDPTNLQQVGLPSGPWSMTGSISGMPGFTRTPCSAAHWAWVYCDATARVIGVNLEGPELGKVNTSWSAKGAQPISGYLPWDKLTVLEKLNYLNVAHQVITGDLTGVGGLTALMNLSISENKFSGSVPAEVSKLKRLLALRVDINQLTGTLPPELGTLNNLAALVVSSNSFAGPFPEWIGNNTALQWLDLSSNPFIGTLPDTWSKLTMLTGMQLQFTQVNGSVPASWSNMKSLGHVGLVSCGITSPYPEFLLKLPDLKQVWLTSNNMYGEVPANYIKPYMIELYIDSNFFNGTLPKTPATANANLDLRVDTNCFSTVTGLEGYNARNYSACQLFYTNLNNPGASQASVEAAAEQATATANANNKKTIIIAVVVVVIVVAALLGLLGYLYWKNTRRARISKLFTKGLRQTSREFTIAELKQATQNWQTVIGKGGYGTVFKAELKDGSFVAVKRLDQVSKQGDVEFIREVELLSRVHHRHLVNLVGFCAERGERALVYEYMAMGSLYEHLHGDSAKQFPLSWDSRCKIAIHVALGIEYLHYGADPPLIHRDIKSANILLSDDGYSKVADFGLCKEAPVGAAADGSEQLVPTATAVRGSFGYLDPEYVNTSILSEKSDVYSYGVVLLELISGHKSIHDWQPLAYWAEEYLADREKTPLMVDPALEGNFDLDELYALCDIARTCVQDQSVNRPTIRDVAKALVENLGHGMSSFTGSLQDSASIVPSSQSDASSMPSTTYTPSSASNEVSNEFTYQNYSETLHWTPNASGNMSSKDGTGIAVSTGAKGDRLPVPVPKRPGEGKGGNKDDVEKGSS